MSNMSKRLIPSRLHELQESKFPFVSRIKFIRSKLSNFSAHVYGVTGSIGGGDGDDGAARVKTTANKTRTLAIIYSLHCYSWYFLIDDDDAEFNSYPIGSELIEGLRSGSLLHLCLALFPPVKNHVIRYCNYYQRVSMHYFVHHYSTLLGRLFIVQLNEYMTVIFATNWTNQLLIFIHIRVGMDWRSMLPAQLHKIVTTNHRANSKTANVSMKTDSWLHIQVVLQVGGERRTRSEIESYI